MSSLLTQVADIVSHDTDGATTATDVPLSAGGVKDSATGTTTYSVNNLATTNSGTPNYNAWVAVRGKNIAGIWGDRAE